MLECLTIFLRQFFKKFIFRPVFDYFLKKGFFPKKGQNGPKMKISKIWPQNLFRFLYYQKNLFCMVFNNCLRFLGLFCPLLIFRSKKGQFTLFYPILVEMGGFAPHFMDMGWFHSIFSSVGWKWCPGGPGVETPTKPKLFLCLFRGPGHRKVRFGVDFHQKRGYGCFFGENHQNGWNSAEFHHFHQIPRFRAFPAARAPKRAWNLHVLQRVLQGPPGTGVNADFT